MGERTPKSRSDVFTSMWQTDAGSLLKELLKSPHFRQFWGFDETDLLPGAGLGVLGMKVELGHKWEDDLHEGQSLPSSGLQESFQDQSSLHVLKAYLGLFDNIDRFAKFMSMIEHYKLLANIGGDAGMYHLRASLHHLLQELELVLLPMEQETAQIMDSVKRVVRDIALTDSQPSGKRLLWIERLQAIDESSQAKSFLNFRDTMSELRYLSCDARLPALQSACQQSLSQITAIMDSPEFLRRCTENPPALESPTFEAIADGPASPEEGDDSGIVVISHTLWSLQHEFRVQQDEMQTAHLPDSLKTQIRSCSASEVGDIVADLNNGKIPDPGVCYILQCHGTTECIILHKADQRELAVEVLGLGESERRRSVQRNVTRCCTELSVQEEPGQASEEGVASVTTQTVVDPAAAVEPARASEEVAALMTTQTVVDPAAAVENAVSLEKQATFYEVLFAAILPLFEQDEHLTASQLRKLLARSNLDGSLLEQILATERDALRHDSVDSQILKRLGCLVAHAQCGLTDVVAAQRRDPHNVPVLRGILWDERRPKRVSITEPF